jgi:DNA-binding XRE family transcriptional regulator
LRTARRGYKPNLCRRRDGLPVTGLPHILYGQRCLAYSKTAADVEENPENYGAVNDKLYVLLLSLLKGLCLPVIQLRKYRYDAGLTQAELAEALGCSEGTIHFWEIGHTKRPYPRMGKKLRDFFDVPVDELFKPVNENSPGTSAEAA